MKNKKSVIEMMLLKCKQGHDHVKFVFNNDIFQGIDYIDSLFL